jgi:epoxyqueuosine reductase
VVGALGEAGYPAVAPVLSPEWEWRESERHVFASNWSERHAAYASGLGTFGLCQTGVPCESGVPVVISEK